MRILLFTLITLICSLSYGQVPVTKDKLIILITNSKQCQTSRNAEQIFTSQKVREHLLSTKTQLIIMRGQDLDRESHLEWKITHYPALVYFIKKDGEYELNKTVSGLKHSAALGVKDQAEWLLGINNKPKTPPPIQNIQRTQPQIQYSIPNYMQQSPSS